MELRLRRLISSRRVKSQPNELELHRLSGQTAPVPSPPPSPPSPGRRFPVLIHQALGKAQTPGNKHERASVLQSLSYDSAVPGKPPKIGGRPQRGNGPVKLQTSRRLSSGELLVTNQDYYRTLEDILEGDYIVGGKEKRNSRVQSVRSPMLDSAEYHPAQSPPMQPGTGGSMRAPSSIMSSPYANTTSPVPLSEVLSSPLSRQSTQDSDSGPICPRSQSPYLPGDGWSGGLGISTPLHGGVIDSTHSSTSLVEPAQDQNVTLQALWKAESSHLVALYGQSGGPDRRAGEFNQDQSRARRQNGSYPYRHNYASAPSLSTQFATLDHNHGWSVTKPGDQSHDEYSDESSNKRFSLLSSSAASSSYTVQTSLAEEPVTTRGDLRKLVDDMRMTYLRAIETQPPLSAELSLPKQRTTPRKQRTLLSSASVDGELYAAARPDAPRHTSWQQASFSVSPYKRGGRKSLPVAGFSTLPAIEASPSKDDPGADCGLKRADSTTLGAMMASVTEKEISDQRALRSTRRTRDPDEAAGKTITATSTMWQQQARRPVEVAGFKQEIDAATEAGDFESPDIDLSETSPHDAWQSPSFLLAYSKMPLPCIPHNEPEHLPPDIVTTLPQSLRPK